MSYYEKSGLALSSLSTAYILLISGASALLIITGVISGHDFSIQAGPLRISLLIIASLIIGRELVERNLAYKFSLSIFIIILLSIAFKSIYATSPSSYDDVFATGSRNAVSSWLLVAAAAITLAHYRDTNKVLIVPALIVALVSLAFATRSSIFFSTLLLSIIIFRRFGVAKTISFIIPLIALLLWTTFDKIGYLFEQTKFVTDGTDSPRWVMWSAYINQIEIGSFIFGLPVQHVEIIEKYNNNPHNSFIRLHSIFGVIPFLFLSVFIFILARKIEFFAFSIFILIFGRAFTDTIFLGFPLDILFFVLLFLTINIKKDLKNIFYKPS